jgi:hypothetical protein
MVNPKWVLQFLWIFQGKNSQNATSKNPQIAKILLPHLPQDPPRRVVMISTRVRSSRPEVDLAGSPATASLFVSRRSLGSGRDKEVGQCADASPDARPLERRESIDFSKSCCARASAAGRFAVALASCRRSSLARCFDDAERCSPVVRPSASLQSRNRHGLHPGYICTVPGWSRYAFLSPREPAAPLRREVKRAKTNFI